MTTIRHDLHAACPPDRVWKLLADLEAVKRYNHTVKSVAIVGEQRDGVGARRSCELLPSGRVVERVTHWDNERALGLEIAESDWPVTFMRWVTRLAPDPKGTRITQDLEYRMKLGPIGWLLDKLVMRNKLRSTLDRVLAELVRQAEAA